jgi:predicted ArsR family transcriptional regulator
MGRRPLAIDAPDGDALRRARALSVPTRRAVLDLLRGAEAPMTPQQLAAELGVHHTAVRQHLTVLADVGMVEAMQLPSTGRGRPRVAYLPLADPDPYQRLSTMLADALNEGITPREAGRRHGRDVTPSADGAIATLLAETERLGFHPRLREGRGRLELVLEACPFADVAAVAPQIVCDLHLGIAEGIADRTGGIEVVDLRAADPRTAGCRLITRPSPGTT